MFYFHLLALLIRYYYPPYLFVTISYPPFIVNQTDHIMLRHTHPDTNTVVMMTTLRLTIEKYLRWE